MIKRQNTQLEEVTQVILNARAVFADEEESVRYWCNEHKILNWQKLYRQGVSEIKNQLPTMLNKETMTFPFQSF